MTKPLKVPINSNPFGFGNPLISWEPWEPLENPPIEGNFPFKPNGKGFKLTFNPSPLSPQPIPGINQLGLKTPRKSNSPNPKRPGEEIKVSLPG